MSEFTLFVTSRCNLHCEECVMGKFMKHNAGYEMSLEELDAFLDVTKRSGYVFDIIVCGGEPLLWKHLAPGVRAIRESGVASKVLIFSNAINIKQVTDEVMQYVTQVRISKYDSNAKNTDQLVHRYPDKIRVVERREFWRLPTVFIEGTLPQDCLTPERLYMQGKVFACPHSASVNDGKDELEDGCKLYVPLQMHYLDGLDEILKRQERLCMKCISNVKVRDFIETFKKRDHSHVTMI